MKVISVMGIDLAKSVFHICGQDSTGVIILRKKVSRKELMKFIANTPRAVIGIEACGGANHWARQFTLHGHTVKVMAAQYVKPFVKTNKNDFNDAEAICEAVQRPNMYFVPQKTLEQQDIQIIHRVRTRLIRNRTALCNEIRGFLSEYGIVAGLGLSRLRKCISDILSSDDSLLSVRAKKVISRLFSEWVQLETEIVEFNKEITQVFHENETCQRISKIPGVGVITSTAIVAAVGDAKVFKNGRQMSAWLGLVPRQCSSGGKSNLLGISKRGDKYLRGLLIHGGRSVVTTSENKTDSISKWVNEKAKSRGKNRAAVAVGNKNVRIIWKLLVTKGEYRAAA